MKKYFCVICQNNFCIFVAVVIPINILPLSFRLKRNANGAG